MSNANSVPAVTLPPVLFTSTIPESVRAGGRGAGENPFQQFMVDMPAPAMKGKGKDAQMQFAHFFVPADPVSDTITDPKEREKAEKAGTSKLVSRFTSISRRIRKTRSDTHDYTFRKARDPSNPTNGKWGIIVYRIAPGTDKGGPRKAATAS